MPEPITVKSHAQLNALIAEKVMGFNNARIAPEFKALWTPLYSTDMNAAMLVADKYGFVIWGSSVWENRDNFTEDHHRAFYGESRIGPLATAITLPVAICIAALKIEGVTAILQLEPQPVS